MTVALARPRVRVIRLALIGLGVAALALSLAGCGPAAWPNSTIYVENHAGRAWPVRTAVQQWDAGLHVSVQYGACRAGAGCIRVYEAKLGLDRTGQTDMEYAEPGVMSKAVVTFNSEYDFLADAADPGLMDTAELLSTACHELGHALGIAEHSTDPTSCMQVPPEDDRSYRPVASPSKADFAALNEAAKSAAEAVAG
jgi:predicted Zn-dependent protease